MKKNIKELVKKLYKTNEYGYEYQDPDAVADPELVKYFEKNYNIRTDVHRSCVNCQIRQITKYDDPNSKKKNTFKPQCGFIPKSLPPGSSKTIKEIALKSDMPIERAKKLLLSTIDPVAWCEVMFGFSDEDQRWSIRSYQKEQLRCTSKRIAVREGRRSGKTFAMALKLLYYAYNLRVEKGRDSDGNPVILGPDIMVVTPYQAQLTNIFEEIESLIKRNTDLRSEVTTGTADNLYIKTPTFKMEFKNGSTIQGFVSGLGVKEDGSGGGTMRGQSAHVIYLDEMDMIPEDILDKVVSPILATTPDTIMIATSTPIGKRAKFYNWCLTREDFKEDYYPTTVLPHWEQIKEEIESESTKESFATEYMAEFIEGMYGVFRPSWIQAARADYEYLVSRPDARPKIGVVDYENMLVSIGIDWNKNAGTEFFVLGYAPNQGLWYALDAINVPASENSSQRWMQEVLRLNYKWKPDWIYADEGYGHTIIEDLHYQSQTLRGKRNKTQMDLQTVKLSDRLVAFNFSKNVILKDPITGQDIKKAGKHFLVENAVRTLEDGLFKFPSSDETLKKQLSNYVILRRQASTNKPVYGMENERIGDHRLDAMMLALAALSLQESIYSGKNLPISSPGLVEIDKEKSYISPQREARDILNNLKKHKVPGAFSVLQILRGNGSEEEQKAIHQKYIRQGLIEENKPRNRSSKFIKENNKPSLLEGIQQNVNSPTSGDLIGETHHIPFKRKNKKSRGWRK